MSEESIQLLPESSPIIVPFGKHSLRLKKSKKHEPYQCQDIKSGKKPPTLSETTNGVLEEIRHDFQPTSLHIYRCQSGHTLAQFWFDADSSSSGYILKAVCLANCVQASLQELGIPAQKLPSPFFWRCCINGNFGD